MYEYTVLHPCTNIIITFKIVKSLFIILWEQLPQTCFLAFDTKNET